MPARSRAWSGGSASSLLTMRRTASVSDASGMGSEASALAGSPVRLPRKRMKDIATPWILMAACCIVPLLRLTRG